MAASAADIQLQMKVGRMYSPSLTSPNCVLIIPCPSSLGVTAFLRENVRGAIKTATCVGSGRRCIGEMLAAQWMVVAWQPQSGSERCCASTPWMDAFDPIKASVVFGDHTGVARLMKSQTSGLDPLSERIQIRQRAQRDAPGARSPLTFTSSRSVVAPCYPRTVFTPTFSSGHDVMRFSSIVLLPVALASLVAAGPIAEKRASFTLQNGRDAQALNRKFQSLSANAPCNSGENACINGGFAQCANGKWVTFPCNAGLKCFALPLVLSPGTRFVPIPSFNHRIYH